jgi:hypothetical protein
MNRIRDGIPYSPRPRRGDSFAPLYQGVPREIFTKPRPFWRRITLRGWVWIVGTVGSSAFWGYLIWSLGK